MGSYVGFKMIEAEPQMESESGRHCIEDREGYKVVYPDGYVSWSPKEVFEKAYMQVGDNNTITVENVENFIKETQTYLVGNKSTMLSATLANGYVIIESSSCVDPVNYNEEIGKRICMDKIKDKIWMLLGFLLQTAKNGVK